MYISGTLLVNKSFTTCMVCLYLKMLFVLSFSMLASHCSLHVPDKRYPNDITPAKSAIKVICYYMEMISARVSKRSTEGDDLSEFLPTYILIGDQLIVKCAEWNGSKQYDILK